MVGETMQQRVPNKTMNCDRVLMSNQFRVDLFWTRQFGEYLLVTSECAGGATKSARGRDKSI